MYYICSEITEVTTQENTSATNKGNKRNRSMTSIQSLSPYQREKYERDKALMGDYYKLRKRYTTLRSVLDELKPKYQLHSDNAFYRIRKRWEGKYGKPEDK